MNKITACKYCLAAGECTGLCSDVSELSVGAYYAGYDAGYEKGKAEAVADYEKRLRDEFAMAALNCAQEDCGSIGSSIEVVCDLSYVYADAMLEARKE